MRTVKPPLVPALLILPLLVIGCYRGQTSQKPPVHIIPDMDSQPRYDTQQLGQFFQDKLAMRIPDGNTVALGRLHEDVAYFTGREKTGIFVKEVPAVTMTLLERGRERFDIFCAPCHGRLGDGKGIVVGRGFVPAPTFHDDRLRQVEDGYVFDVISNGRNTMPGYAAQIPVKDRWAIAAYLRALQRAQNATFDDVPSDMREQLVKQ